MFLFALAHGARASEIANLRVSDIDFRNEQIHIARLEGLDGLDAEPAARKGQRHVQ